MLEFKLSQEEELLLNLGVRSKKGEEIRKYFDSSLNAADLDLRQQQWNKILSASELPDELTKRIMELLPSSSVDKKTVGGLFARYDCLYAVSYVLGLPLEYIEVNHDFNQRVIIPHAKKLIYDIPRVTGVTFSGLPFEQIERPVGQHPVLVMFYEIKHMEVESLSPKGKWVPDRIPIGRLYHFGVYMVSVGSDNILFHKMGQFLPEMRMESAIQEFLSIYTQSEIKIEYWKYDQMKN